MLLTQDFSLVASVEEPFYGLSSYLGIGHKIIPGKEPPILWVYDGGISKQPMESREDDHGEIWGERVEDLYRGRYEPWSGRLSVTGPADAMSLRELPESLVEALHRSFPKITKIVEFD
jgi:hypothetical protein